MFMKAVSKDFTPQLILHRESLLHFAKTLTKNNDDANDLLQETLLKAIVYKKHYKEDTNLKAWLYTIMKNIFINNYRKQVKTRIIFDGSQDLHYLNVSETNKQLDPEKRFEQKEVLNSMQRLEDDYKNPLIMYYEGFKYREIADELQLPIGTIKSRIFLGRKQLAEQFQSRGASVA